MKKLLSDPSTAVCGDILRLMQANGIECILRNESPQPILGGASSPLCSIIPELWVVHDEEFSRALELISRDGTPEADASDDPD